MSFILIPKTAGKPWITKGILTSICRARNETIENVLHIQL